MGRDSCLTSQVVLLVEAAVSLCDSVNWTW